MSVDARSPRAEVVTEEPADHERSVQGSPLLTTRGLGVRYGDTVALAGIDLEIRSHQVHAVIGSAGAGKTTLLRVFNRMNELVAASTLEGKVLFHDEDLYGPDVDPLTVRRRIGMVFERPRPFPQSIFDNLAWGLRIHGVEDRLEARIEHVLDTVGLWRELADRLEEPATSLPLGAQQRLCIARALVLEPEVLLMDAPCTGLDTTSTAQIEDLLFDLKERTTIVLVPHSLRQTSRVADTATFLDEGRLIETGPTEEIFTRPRLQRTEAFVTGRPKA